jgi:hypothetical protein
VTGPVPLVVDAGPAYDVIQPLDPASNQEASKPAAAKSQADRSAPGAHYASLHAAAVAGDTQAAKTTSPRRERMTVPDGETWEATKPGSHYALITDGPRKGLYINLTHGDRRGETFKIEHRGGNTLHVYTKSGKEVLVRPSVDAGDVTNAAKHAKPPHDKPHEGEKWVPVAGANYADILGGSRNGLYVNISGGIRDGMAFQIVKKAGKWFHVYGTGKERQWIPSDGPKHKTQQAGATTPSHAAAGGTGGTAAPGA